MTGPAAAGAKTIPWLAVGLGSSCLTAAVVLSLGRPRPASWQQSSRDLQVMARPLVLPFVWQALADADHAVDRTRWHQRARLLMRLLPEWTDGHTLFATQEALEPVNSPAEAADRLTVALGWMESIVNDQPPRRAAEVLSTMASLVDTILMTGDEARREAIESRFALQPERLAQGYRERAAQLDPDAVVAERRIFGQIAVLRGALRARDVPVARRLIGRIRTELAQVRDQEIAQAWQSSLEILDRWLVHGRKGDLETLRADPLLEDIAPLLTR